jgi:hypothetical protein
MSHLSAKNRFPGGAEQWASICVGKSTGAKLALHMRSMCGEDLNPLNLNDAVGQALDAFSTAMLQFLSNMTARRIYVSPNRPTNARNAAMTAAISSRLALKKT